MIHLFYAFWTLVFGVLSLLSLAFPAALIWDLFHAALSIDALAVISIGLMPHIVFTLLANCCFNRRRESIKGIFRSVSKPVYSYPGWTLLLVNSVLLALVYVVGVEPGDRFVTWVFWMFILPGYIFVSWSRQKALFA